MQRRPPRIRLLRRRPVQIIFNRTRKRIDHRRIRPGHPRRRHHPRAQFKDNLLPLLRRDVLRRKRQPPGLGLIVVAGDAILIDEPLLRARRLSPDPTCKARKNRDPFNQSFPSKPQRHTAAFWEVKLLTRQNYRRGRGWCQSKPPTSNQLAKPRYLE